jgi:hemerythrin-like domain-containing protein
MIQIGAPSATLDAPVDHLVACHRRIEQRLDTLAKAADALISERQAALDAIRKSLLFLDSNGAMHTADEEESLFPLLRPKLAAQDLSYLDGLEQQHDEAEAAYADLRRILTRISSQPDPGPELVAEYRAAAEHLREIYRAHIASEDEVLTGIARRTLSEADLEQLSDEMRRRRVL